MGSKKTAFAVGAFVILGLALALAAIIWLGMSHYLDKGKIYAAYFDESVQGLDRDSPVKYRGVQIGRVERIALAPDARLVETLLSVETDLSLASGVVAQLKSVGITGIMYVELDIKEKDEADRSPEISFSPEYPVIPTKPSGIKMFMDGMDVVLAHIEAFDSKGLAGRLKDTVDNFNQTLKDARVEELSADIRSTLYRVEDLLDKEKIDRIMASLADAGETLNKLLENADGRVSDLGRHLERISDSADRTLTHIDRLAVDGRGEVEKTLTSFRRRLETAEGFLAAGRRMVNTADARITDAETRLSETLENLDAAVDDLNALIDLLADHPSLLFFGEAPPREFP